MKIKTCPECGTDNVYAAVYDFGEGVVRDPLEYHGHLAWRVCCLECGLEGPSYSGPWIEAEAKAISHWNAYDHRV